jgi:hypothetical protein
MSSGLALPEKFFKHPIASSLVLTVGLNAISIGNLQRHQRELNDLDTKPVCRHERFGLRFKRRIDWPCCSTRELNPALEKQDVALSVE